MKSIATFYRRYPLKTWFYGVLAAVLTWPFIMFVALMLLYDGKLAPGYTSPWAEQAPVLFFALVQLALHAALLGVSAVLAWRVVTVWKKLLLGVLAFVALLLTSQNVTGLVLYIDLIT